MVARTDLEAAIKRFHEQLAAEISLDNRFSGAHTLWLSASSL